MIVWRNSIHGRLGIDQGVYSRGLEMTSLRHTFSVAIANNSTLQLLGLRSRTDRR